VPERQLSVTFQRLSERAFVQIDPDTASTMPARHHRRGSRTDKRIQDDGRHRFRRRTFARLHPAGTITPPSSAAFRTDTTL
jgi:hypothetical protein